MYTGVGEKTQKYLYRCIKNKQGAALKTYAHLLTILNQAYSFPFFVTFYLYGLPFVLAFVLGARGDSLEKDDLTSEASDSFGLKSPL